MHFTENYQLSIKAKINKQTMGELRCTGSSTPCSSTNKTNSTEFDYVKSIMTVTVIGMFSIFCNVCLSVRHYSVSRCTNAPFGIFKFLYNFDFFLSTNAEKCCL